MDHIKQCWEEQARKFKDSPEVSWGDFYAMNLEIQNIAKHIQKGDGVLDVGCGNGWSTEGQLKRNPKEIVGVDFSKQMIQEAKKRETSVLSFEVGDVLNLTYLDKSFDVVYTTRCLINLPTWEQQMQGIKECIRVAKREVVLSEGFWESLVLLNSMRKLVSLPSLVEHDFNRYLKKSKLEKFLKSLNLNFVCDDFSSVYYLGSRFLRELVTEIDKYEGFTNPINGIFYDIEKDYSGGGFGIQQSYTITL